MEMTTTKHTRRSPGRALVAYRTEGERIQKLLVGLKRDIMAIGKILTEVNEGLPHGQWLKWLAKYAGFSTDTARRYMQVYKVNGEIPQNASFRLLDLSTIYVMQAPRTPAAAKHEIIEHAKRGHRVTPKTARAIVAKHRPERAEVMPPVKSTLSASVVSRLTQSELLRWLRTIWSALDEDHKVLARQALDL